MEMVLMIIAIAQSYLYTTPAMNTFHNRGSWSLMLCTDIKRAEEYVLEWRPTSFAYYHSSRRDCVPKAQAVKLSKVSNTPIWDCKQGTVFSSMGCRKSSAMLQHRPGKMELLGLTQGLKTESTPKWTRAALLRKSRVFHVGYILFIKVYWKTMKCSVCSRGWWKSMKWVEI